MKNGIWYVLFAIGIFWIINDIEHFSCSWFLFYVHNKMLSAIVVSGTCHFSLAPNLVLCSSDQLFLVFHKWAFAVFGTRMVCLSANYISWELVLFYFLSILFQSCHSVSFSPFKSDNFIEKCNSVCNYLV